MSRSRKKSNVYKDRHRNHHDFFKRLGNKAVRKYADPIPNGNSFKKLYLSWNISDYSFSYTWEEWTYFYGESQDARNQWEKWYLRK